jgi:hypothetical protein
MSNRMLIRKDQMLNSINCDFKESLVVPYDYILKRKRKQKSIK